MSTVMVVGASRGLGREFVAQYLADGWRVIATARDQDTVGALRQAGAEANQLDVTDHQAIAALAATLATETIDVLIHNAGVYGPRTATWDDMDFAAWRDVFEVNTLSPLAVISALVEPVARSQRRTIAVLSSKMGSLSDNTSGGQYIYRSSKAALNMVVKSLSRDLAGRGICCLSLHPGWVRTEMGGPSALIDATTSVRGLRQVIDTATPAQSGGFFNYDGSSIPW